MAMLTEAANTFRNDVLRMQRHALLDDPTERTKNVSQDYGKPI